MNGELFEIIYNFCFALFSSPESNLMTFYDLNDSFIKSIFVRYPGETTFLGSLASYLEENGFYPLAENWIAWIFTWIVTIILIILLFRLFKWIFNLIFKLFRLN